MRFFLALFLAVAALHAQPDSKQKMKNARDLYKKSGASAIPELRGYLKDADSAVRREATRLIVEAGSPASMDALLEASQDGDDEVQIRAITGLVNIYLPGYVNRGNVFGRTSRGIKGAFTDTNDRVIERYVVVRPEVQDAMVHPRQPTRGKQGIGARGHRAIREVRELDRGVERAPPLRILHVDMSLASRQNRI